jgi:sugar phosphate isomerase/epimerase
MNLNQSRDLSRRGFFSRSASGLSVAILSRGLAGGSGKIPIAVQLYSVRREFGMDQPGTLAAIAKMGFKGVEFAGYFKRSAAELRKMLDDNGLQCCGTHLSVDALTGDALEKTMEFNQVLGNKLLIVPGFPPKKTESRSGWLEYAKLFTELVPKVKASGMRVGYHNHGVEFKPLEGEMPFDTFFGHTPKDVVMQVDIGTAVEAGVDPVSLFKKYPGRVASVHLKEFSRTKPSAYLGEGEAKWKEIFNALEKQKATQWYIVEYEFEDRPPLESIERCLQNMHKLGR